MFAQLNVVYSVDLLLYLYTILTTGVTSSLKTEPSSDRKQHKQKKLLRVNPNFFWPLADKKHVSQQKMRYG